MEEFVDKLYFHHPEESTGVGETIPANNEPLRSWAKFFVSVGLKLAEQDNPNGTRESLVISVPSRNLAASLITFGLIKGISGHFDEAYLDEHHKRLSKLPIGTSLSFRVGNDYKPAEFVRFDPKTDAIIVKTTHGSTKSGAIERHFYKPSCDKLQLSDTEVQLPIGTEKKGKRIVTHPNFLKAVLEKTNSDIYISNLQPQTVILGRKNLLIEEMTNEHFSFGSENVTGCLDDLIRLRSGGFRSLNFGAFIIPRDGDGSKRFSKFPALQRANYVIFDGPKSFLYWRRDWLEHNWIVLLSRTETSFQEAVIDINGQVSRNERSGLMDEIAGLGIPGGIELISFSRKLWN